MSGVKERKNTCDLNFSIIDRRCRPTTSPGAKPFLLLTFIKSLQGFIVVFGLKRPIKSVQDSSFARPCPSSHRRRYFQKLAAVVGFMKSFQLHFSPYFAPAVFFLVLKVKSELGSCLLTQGTFKKSV
jgi:hypothetical protein